MRTARSVERRWAAPIAVLLLALTVAVTIILLAGQAWAADSSTATTAPATEVCAPGAMTITRDGPVVYDGVDCQPGPAASPAAATTSAVPSATVLRPASGPPAASDSHDSTVATRAATISVVVALFGVVVALLALTRRRHRALLASGWE